MTSSAVPSAWKTTSSRSAFGASGGTGPGSCVMVNSSTSVGSETEMNRTTPERSLLTVFSGIRIASVMPSTVGWVNQSVLLWSIA